MSWIDNDMATILFILMIIVNFFLFILGIAVCFAIISMSNSLKGIRNLYFRLHWDDVEKFRLQDKNED